jgi:demethylmenaquinone methyltransferase/2-methoxy-6-polyprenyl-1,4-benzoquinol methylase
MINNHAERKQTEAPSRRQVWRMFDRIARRYDFLNHTLSFGRDVAWRKKLVGLMPEKAGQIVLDLATGTGDVLLSLTQKSEKIEYGIGIDMAREMMNFGRAKIEEQKKPVKLQLLPGDALHIPFKNSTFDLVTIAFGIRNFADIDQSLQEIYRVLATSGRLLILEFSLPENVIIRAIYLFYFRYMLPGIGGLISGDRNAYHYLNRTVETFPYGADFSKFMEQNGFVNVGIKPLTFRVASIYRGDKP